MAGIMKISDAASLALHASAFLAARKDERTPTSRIAEALSVSAAHLAKVMGKLEHAGLVLGTRGPAGGFELAVAPSKISLKDVYEAIEGPIETQHCMLEGPACGGRCMLGGLMRSVDDEVRAKLKALKLSDVAGRFRAIAGSINRTGPRSRSGKGVRSA